MNEYLYEIINQSGDLLIGDVVLRIAFSMILGGVIYLSYWFSHYGNVYSKKFNVTLVILTILTTTVMTVIGNNVALSLGMVGALSIIRFRTSVKDSRDTIYIFWTIIVGICAGVGDFTVATIGSCAVFLILLLFGNIKNNNRVLLVIRGSREKEHEIRRAVFGYFDKAPQLKVNNSTSDNVEFIYEISKKSLDNSISFEKKAAISEDRKPQSIMDRLYSIGDIDYVNIVVQNDEIV